VELPGHQISNKPVNKPVRFILVDYLLAQMKLKLQCLRNNSHHMD